MQRTSSDDDRGERKTGAGRQLSTVLRGIGSGSVSDRSAIARYETSFLSWLSGKTGNFFFSARRRASHAHGSKSSSALSSGCNLTQEVLAWS